MLVHRFLEDSAQRRPEAAAIVHGDETLTYGELHRKSDAVASFLISRGVRPGDRVGLLAQNSSFYVEAYYGILKAGGIVVALNAAAESEGIVECLADCTASALLSGPRFGRVLEAAVPRLPLLRLVVDADRDRPFDPADGPVRVRLTPRDLLRSSTRPQHRTAPGSCCARELVATREHREL